MLDEEQARLVRHCGGEDGPKPPQLKTRKVALLACMRHAERYPRPWSRVADLHLAEDLPDKPVPNDCFDVEELVVWSQAPSHILPRKSVV